MPGPRPAPGILGKMDVREAFAGIAVNLVSSLIAIF
jgi:hypothetical protein